MIDFEGFYTYPTFHFKEIAVYFNYNKTITQYFIKSPDYLQHNYNNKTYNWVVENHHGIPYEYGDTNLYKVLNKLKKFKIIFCKDIIKQKILIVLY